MIHNFYFFYKGLVTGITIAAIGGPVSILCIRQTMHEGLFAGIAIGFGAALADALFGCTAVFGITAISNFLLCYNKIISLLGGGSLIYFSLRIFFEQSNSQASQIKATKKNGIVKNTLSSFFITLTNPATILFFTAISVSLGGFNNYHSAYQMVSGIFLGSIALFSALAFVITIFHTKITLQQVVVLNKIFGAALLIFGVFISIKALI